MSVNKKDVKKSTDATNGKNEPRKKQQAVRSMQSWDDIVGQRIAQAMKDGEFDNLPGEGKPQKLDKNPFAGDRHLAFDIMQNNDVAPAWITRRKEVSQQIDTLRAALQAEVNQHQRDLVSAKSSIGTDSLDKEIAKGKINATWSKKRQQWEVEIAALNTKIRNLNIEQPLPNMEILILHFDEELAKASAG